MEQGYPYGFIPPCMHLKYVSNTVPPSISGGTVDICGLMYSFNQDISVSWADLDTGNKENSKKYYIYIGKDKKPHISLSAPIYSQRGAEYHPLENTWRYIGYFYTDTDGNTVLANESKINNSGLEYDPTKSEIKLITNKLVATKELVIGSDGAIGNWIANTTPILRTVSSEDSSYNYLIINTKMIAYGYTGGRVGMFDITLKTYSFGSDIFTDNVLQVRITGYAYNNNSFLRFRSYIQGNNAGNIQVIGFVDNTSGEIRFALYSPTFKFSSYYRFTEIYLNYYHYALKAFVDGWSISYSDTITNYNPTWGIQYAKVQGDVYSEGSWFTLASTTCSGASSYQRHFILNKPCVIKVISSATPTQSYIVSQSAIFYGSQSNVNNATYSIFLGAGKYYVSVFFSTTTSTTLTLYTSIVQNYSPYSLWSATDICPSGFTTS